MPVVVKSLAPAVLVVECTFLVEGVSRRRAVFEHEVPVLAANPLLEAGIEIIVGSTNVPDWALVQDKKLVHAWRSPCNYGIDRRIGQGIWAIHRDMHLPFGYFRNAVHGTESRSTAYGCGCRYRCQGARIIGMAIPPLLQQYVPAGRGLRQTSSWMPYTTCTP